MTDELLSQKAAVGCIGLGIMGAPAAHNMRRGGYSLHVYARNPNAAWQNRVGDLADLPRYDSAAALAAVCDAVVINVSDTPDVEEVTLGEKGLLSELKSGAIVVDMSTIAPAAARNIAAEMKKRGVFFIDAPVSGGQKGAKDGTLTIMAGGDETAFARALPLLKTMGKTITRIGDSGAGQVAKACNQIIIGATIEGVAEAINLANKNGVDAAMVRQALLGGFAASKVLEMHGKRMLDGDYTPGFKTKLHVKDMQIALKDGNLNGCDLPSAELFVRRLQYLMENGDGELDSAAVYKAVVGE